MIYWKVQLDAAGSFPGIKAQRFRAVVLADSMDDAIARARARLPSSERMTAAAMAYDDRENAQPTHAADHFMNRGYALFVPVLIAPGASRMMEP